MRGSRYKTLTCGWKGQIVIKEDVDFDALPPFEERHYIEVEEAQVHLSVPLLLLERLPDYRP